MNTLLILLTQTKSGATLEILFLLLVAAIIGYITAWLYSKSIYLKKTEISDAEKRELNKRIRNLECG